MKRFLSVCVALAASIAASAEVARAADLDARTEFNIASQPLEMALLRFSEQASIQLLMSSKEIPNRRAERLTGTFSARKALEMLLAGTGLTFEQISESTVAISSGARTFAESSSPKATDRGLGPWQRSRYAQSSSLRTDEGNASSRTVEDAATTEGRAKEVGQLEEVAVNVPEVLVKGSKILNMDIRRTRDDAQPYVVFDRETLSRSGANDVHDFLKNRLSMNTAAFNPGSSTGGNRSLINLRGFGTNQTLILVDGRRVAAPSPTIAVNQADLNGIPLAAVERIEILPTTASGIYGGSATGGVVNVILRRDYVGAEFGVSYDGTFDANASVRKINLNGGFTPGDGKTSIMFAASFSDGTPLRVGDRDFAERGRAAVFANNPGFYLDALSPVVGATTNIRSSDGSNLVLKSGVALNSPITSVPGGYAGPSSDNGAALATNAGRYNLSLPPTLQSDTGTRRSLVGAPTVESAMMTLRHQFSRNLQLFVDTSAANNSGSFENIGGAGVYSLSAAAPGNPFQQDITISAPVISRVTSFQVANYDRRVVVGLLGQLPRGWSAGLDHTWSSSRYSLVWREGFPNGAESAAIASGSLDAFRDAPLDLTPFMTDLISSPSKAILRNTTLRVATPQMRLLGASLGVSALLEHNEESFGGSTQRFLSFDILTPGRSQTVDSAYLESKISLLGNVAGEPNAPKLELQVAGRWDKYRVKGASNQVLVGSTTPIVRAENEQTATSPTVALRFQPASDVALRVSYGRGFVPPAVTQVTPSGASSTNAGAFVDPRRGGQPTGLLQQLGGGSPDLIAEKSESRSIGLIFTPRWLDGLRASLDYTRIEKTDNIVQFPAQTIIDNESLFPHRIVRGAPPAGDPFGVGQITFIDARSVNVSTGKIEAYDLALDGEIDTSRAGTISMFAAATWTPHFQTRILPTSPVVENAGVSAGFFPIKFTANAGATWHVRRWDFGWTAKYFDRYAASANPRVVLNQGGVKVASQTYHDVHAMYRWGSESASTSAGQLLSGTEWRVGIRNVLDEAPPFDAGDSRDFYSRYGEPQGPMYQLSVKKTF